MGTLAGPGRSEFKSTPPTPGTRIPKITEMRSISLGVKSSERDQELTELVGQPAGTRCSWFARSLLLGSRSQSRKTVRRVRSPNLIVPSTRTRATNPRYIRDGWQHPCNATCSAPPTAVGRDGGVQIDQEDRIYLHREGSLLRGARGNGASKRTSANERPMKRLPVVSRNATGARCAGREANR